MLKHFFYKIPLPKSLPQEMRKEIMLLKKIRRKDLVLKRVYTLLCKKFQGGVSWENFKEYFSPKINVLWYSKEKQHCTSLNYLLRILLVKSGHFEEKDIRFRYTLVVFSPHQYLEIFLNNHWIIADPWGGTKGLKLGDYAHGFHYRR